VPRYAAIDIGSNSVRMLAADVHPSGPFDILAADREVTRLGESVFQAGVISDQAADFVCGVLGRMAAIYQRLEVVGIRAVATAAVRDASNQREFIERASKAAGVPVEIISGREEARLIHLGVSAVWPHPKQRIMIVDVGGGSGEIILSENGRIEEAFSKPLGAVRLTGAFLREDPPKPAQIARMQDFIAERLAPVVRRIGIRKCDRAIATSATAAAMVCAVNRVPRDRREEADRLRATLPQVTKLYRELCQRDAGARSRITGIGPRRAQIIVPGIAVLLEVMRKFHLPALHYSRAGVREGLIADLAERGVGAERMLLARDQRQEVERVASRYQVPLKRARKVAIFARTLFQALRPLHKLHPDWARPLEAAAFLIDAGHFIAETGHHKHSEYIVLNSDLPGFTDQEKLQVACLCRFHRKSMPSPRHTQFQQLSPEVRRNLLYLIPILRIADALDSGRELRVESVECEIGPAEVRLRLAGQGRIGLEQWTVERVGPAFESVYQKALVVAGQ
jgi:exopolyphosphatase/guanosine-5'-triphosphate,3'-diphosphate pyrophosphatase